MAEPDAPDAPVPAVLAAEAVQAQIHVIRGQAVLLDADLARLYGVETRVLLQAVRRNSERFPADFAFQLSDDEWRALRSRTVTSNAGRGGRRYAPYAFTEQGVAMLASVLRSERAVGVSIEIVRAFVSMRHALADRQALGRQLKTALARLDQHDAQIEQIVDVLNALLAPKPRRRRPIGFAPPEDP